MSVLKIIRDYRGTIFIVLWPILLLPLPLVLRSKEASCAYCILLMVGFLTSEVVPLSVTSLFPLVLYPLLGIMPSKQVSVQYLNDFLWLFTGALTIAIGVEHTKLHRRFALRILLALGSKPHSLLLGFMVATYIISMGMLNVGSTAVMIPIVEAVLAELEERPSSSHEGNSETVKTLRTEEDLQARDHRRDAEYTASGTDQVACTSSFITLNDKDDHANNEHDPQAFEKLRKGLILCIPYSASIGGIAALTGTGTNLVMAGLYADLFAESDVILSFSIWFAYHLPLSALLLLLSYIWMIWLFAGLKGISWRCRREKSPTEQRIQALLELEYQKLGKLRWSEITVIVVLVMTMLLWFFRNPGFMPGWSVIFPDGYVSDGTVAITMATILFFLPSEKPIIMRRESRSEGNMKPVPAILEWKTFQAMYPWNVLFLVGGGFALAEGASVSGLSEWMGNQLEFTHELPYRIICLVVTCILCFCTQFLGNIPTISLFVPILSRLARQAHVHPLYLLLPAAEVTSAAFMLPVSTATNAMTFSHGYLKVMDLVKAGSMLSVFVVVVSMFFINTYGIAMFGLDEFPAWAGENSTSVLPTTAP